MRIKAALSAIPLLLSCFSAQAETLDSIAAVVNNEAITCYEIEQDTKALIQQLQQSGQTRLPSARELEQRTIDARIAKTLQLQEAKKLELEITNEEVDKSIADIEAKNNLPPGQLEAILTERGMDFSYYRQTLRERLLINKLTNVAVRSKLQISEESMREYYRKFIENPQPIREAHLAQIFLSLPPDPTPEQVANINTKAHRLYERLKRGGNFAQLAALQSDAQNAKQGGEMGWFFQGAISPRFASVMTLPVGGISEPVRSPAGVHIIKILEERWHEPESAGESHNEVHARHILIKLPTSADEATQAKIRHRAESIARDMQKASDEEFATRASEVSQGPSASRGGDLGWFQQGQMVPAFEEAAFKLDAGGTSGVVESPFGLHIIRVIAKRHIDPNSFEARHDSIEQVLKNAEMQEQLPRWLASLKAQASIKINTCSNLMAEK
ncbi:MAG: peptidylprolyl isomerase [Mariprofundaceae bacterium]